MKDIQYTHIEENEFATLIAADVEIQGTVKTQDIVLIKGSIVNGNVHGGMICVAAEGRIEGTIKTAHLIVSGIVEGELNISENIHVLKSGEVKGRVETVDIVIDKGAKFNSTCKMVSRKYIGNEK